MAAERADWLRDLGRWAEAKVAYEEHLARHPEDSSARVGYSSVLLALGDHEEAIAELDRVLDRDPADANARYHRALIYAATQQDDRAIADLDTLIRAAPGDWYLWADRCGLHHRARRLEQAVRDGREAVRLAPGEPAAHHNLGLVLGRIGQFGEAHDHLARAAKAGIPGAAAARDQARTELLAAANSTELTEAITLLLGAGSRRDVERLADSRPYMLAPAFAAVVERFARDFPQAISPAGWRRMEDLRKLHDG